jgi:hypothetical protein
MIGDNPLTSLTNYSHFVAEVLDRPTTLHSTVVVWSDSPYTGIAEGEVFFSTGIRLRLREELDFDYQTQPAPCTGDTLHTPKS